MKDKVLGELKNSFKPEFLNRIDATIVFSSLRARMCARSSICCSTAYARS